MTGLTPVFFPAAFIAFVRLFPPDDEIFRNILAVVSHCDKLTQ
jgi:hypothetical protein